MEGHEKIGGSINSRVSFFASNGRRVKFWKDIWCGNELLSVSFPSLFVIDSLKEAWWWICGLMDLWT